MVEGSFQGGMLMNDEQIITLYVSRDQQAITETDTQYGSYCHQIALRILGSNQDAEETVNDTWLHTWDSIPPNHPSALKLYLAKITRNLAFSRYRSKAAQKRGGSEIEMALEELSECVSSTGSIDDELN
jgi:RNA polymerase sigma-70 factor (ECF subfamily)